MLHSSICITVEDRTKLKKLAKDKGYIVSRGPYVGEGSISKLIRALARGELTAIKLRGR